MSELTNHIDLLSIDEEKREEYMYDINESEKAIKEWMHHIIRGVQQEKAKASIMGKLISENTQLYTGPRMFLILVSPPPEEHCKFDTFNHFYP